MQRASFLLNQPTNCTSVSLNIKKAYKVIQEGMTLILIGNEHVNIKSQMANKMKHFIGRLAHNSIPLRQFLKRRGVKLETIYPMCYRLDEHGGHLFLRCKSMHQLWRSLRLEEKHIQLSNCSSANMS